MKIAVITLPLHTNYGGLLQAYALKSRLGKGDEVTVIDRACKMPLPKWWKAPFVYMWRAFRKYVGGEDVEVFREIRFMRELPKRTSEISVFVQKYISPRVVRSYRELRDGEYELIVVGSDQVWRPRYFGRIEDAYLDFTRGWNVRRASYAASFGTDELEYDEEKVGRCARLLAGFDAVSVREISGVEICAEWFGRPDAELVLDPVLLMDQEELRSIAEDVPACRGYVASYILDASQEKRSLTQFVSAAAGMPVADLNPDIEVRPCVQKWIAGFRDAEFVVTDSYHGCILSILFHKPFVALENPARGNSRLHSLLSMLGMDDRLVHGIDPEDDCSFYLAHPDWDEVDGLLEGMRKTSAAYIEKITGRYGQEQDKHCNTCL